MTSFEKLMPFILLLLLLGSGVVLFLALRVEQRLAARKKINLSNYREKNYLFYITKDFTVIVTAAAMALVSLAVGVIALLHPVVRLYAIAAFLLIPVNGITAYFALTRPKFMRDIRVFDGYYVKVADMLANKTSTERDLGMCRKRVQELRDKLAGTLDAFNRNLAKPIPSDFLPSLFAPLDTMISEYEAEIARFSAEIELDFNRALAEFLEKETVSELRVVPVRSFDEQSVDELLATLKTEYAARVTELVIAQVQAGFVTSARALGNIMKLFHGLGIKVDDSTLSRFLDAAARFEDRSALAALLYENKQIPLPVVRQVLIKKDMTWAFVPGMENAFHARELSIILRDLFAADKSEMCHALLSRFNGEKKEILDEALALFEGDENGTMRRARAFSLILGAEYAVGNTGNLFENLAMMLYTNRGVLPLTEEEKAFVREAVCARSFESNAKGIAALYKRVSKGSAPLQASVTRVLLYYLTDDTTPRLFDRDRLVALSSQYAFTLSLSELEVLYLLLAACLLCLSQDAGVTEAVQRELCARSDALAPVKGESTAAHGRRLIAYLLEKRSAVTRSVIYRSESERLTLDRITSLLEKGE